MAPATRSHEMDVENQKLRKNCEKRCHGATLSHEMDVGRQKLRKNCDFTGLVFIYVKAFVCKGVSVCESFCV